MPQFDLSLFVARPVTALKTMSEKDRRRVVDTIQGILGSLEGLCHVLPFGNDLVSGRKFDVSPDIFGWNMKCVETADLMLGICGTSSTGLGFLAGSRRAYRRELVLVAHTDAMVTDLFGDAPDDSIGFPVLRFSDPAEVREIVRASLARIRAERQQMCLGFGASASVAA